MPNYEDVIAVTQVMTDRRDPYDHHSQRTTKYVELLAAKMDFNEHQIKMMSYGAGLHDIGKILISNEVLNLPRKFTKSERAIMQIHPVEGMKILLPLNCDPIVIDMTLHHHERLDGSGYPDRLHGDQVTIYARVLAVSDVYDALTSRRSYREAKSKEQAFAILYDEANKGKLDVALVKLFEELMSTEAAGTNS